MATATSGFVLLDVFVPEILQFCHGAPTILVRSIVKNIIIEFCKRTLCLKAEPASFYVDEDVHTYTLKYASDRYLTLDVEELRLGEDSTNRPLIQTTQNILENSIDGWRTSSSSKPKEFFLTDNINTLRMHPIPNTDSDEEYYTKAIVCPKRDQTEVPEMLYEKWEEVIQAGALAKLLSMPSASWKSPKDARDFRLRYKRGLRNARKTTLTGTGQVSAEVTPRSFEIFGPGTNNRGGLSWV
jgi:hypothetical protein